MFLGTSSGLLFVPLCIRPRHRPITNDH